MFESRIAKRVFATCLSVVLVVGLLPACAFTEDSQQAGMLQAHTLSAQAAAKPSLEIGNVATGKLTLKKGARYKLGAIASSGAKLTYKSNKPKTVSVTKKGSLTAKKTGKANLTITAKAGKAKTVKKIAVNVVTSKKYKHVKKITAKVPTTSLAIGKTTKVKVSFNPANASNKNVVFSSSNASVASVSATGVITAKKAGTATITAKSCANSKAKATIKITVNNTGDKNQNIPDIPGVTKITSFNAYSWAELKAIADAIAAAGSDASGIALAKKYNLVTSDGKLEGATKSLTLTDGTNTSVRIAGFRHDDAATGGKAGITFEFADVPAVHKMNSTSTNKGGWAASEMRSWLNSDFYNLLPAGLRAHITAASKRTNNLAHVGSNDPSVVSASSDKLWLLSLSEVYGQPSSYSSNTPDYPAIHDAEGTQYQLYADKGVTTSNSSFCKKVGANSFWWLRSPGARYSDDFSGVCFNGDWLNYAAADSRGVSPGFCFGDSSSEGGDNTEDENQNVPDIADVTTKTSLNAYSWAELKSIADAIAAADSNEAGIALAKKYNLVTSEGKLEGAAKSLTLTDGTNTNVRIAGFRHDDTATGSKTGITFEFADVPITHEMNSIYTNEGGWAASELRSWLNSDFYNLLPVGLRAHITAASKRTNNKGEIDSNDPSVVSATSDKLWLLSVSEVYGQLSSYYSDVYAAEGTQYQLYADKGVTTDNHSFCEKTGAYSWWWLRSPYAVFSDGCHYVYSDGGWYDCRRADYSYGVSPGFCF